MKVQFELEIGKNKFTLIEDVETNADFFKKLSFYSTLPKVGPNGEDDLVIQYRVAQKQYEYYSIVSQKAGQEFKFGQSKEAKGSLFAKGWEPLYKADGDEDGDSQSAPSGGIGIGAPSAAPAPAAAPAAGASIGIGAPKAATPAPAPAAAKPAAAPAAAPQVAAQAANILSKFGI